MTRLPIAVVGVGHLGKEHARILSSMPEVHLVAVIDPNLAQAEGVAMRCNTRAVADHRAIVGSIRGAVIAAPTCHHHAVARDILQHGVGLLVEKPLANSPTLARDLVAIAKANKATLQVGHIERFNPAFEELCDRHLSPRYIACERFSGFSGRSTDVGVVLDLMIHDLDLVLSLVRSPVASVEAMGVSVLGGNEDLVQARVRFENGCVADLSASRVHPESLRRMRVWGAEGYAGIDFAKRTLSLMQPGEHLRQGRVDSRRLDPATVMSLKTELFARHVHTTEVDCGSRHERDQLTRELDDFVDCLRTGAEPRVTGEAGAEALELAARILTSLDAHQWEGMINGAVGPHQIPALAGRLFSPPHWSVQEGSSQESSAQRAA